MNKEEIIKAYEEGKNKNPTHMIVFRNVLNNEILIKYIERFMKPENEIINMYRMKNGFIVDGVFSYHLDINEQLKELYPYHLEQKSKYSDLYDKALDYASKKHKGMFRKGRIVKPYITHPIEVSKLISMYLYNNPEIETFKIAALLHDTLEDTDATYEEEVKLFGQRIANIVKDVTNDKEKKKKLGKDVYLADKMAKMKEVVLSLKLCDRLQNMDDVRNADDEFNKKYTRETVYIINHLLFNRDLNDVNLRIINDIMKKVKEVSVDNPMPLKPTKLLKIEKENPTC